MNWLRTRVEKERFNPGPLGAFINPFYFARRGLVRHLRQLLPKLHGEVLDVGCGRKPYQQFVPADRYVGVDVDTDTARQLGAADVFFDGSTLPFAAASFDGVLCSQVLEHVFEPDRFVREIARVVRPGGLLVLATPFAWDEHEQPFDYARYSSFGLRALLERQGFEVLEQHKSARGVQAVFQLATAYVYKATRSESRVVNIAAQLALIAPLTIVGVIASVFLPEHPDLYLDNVVLARRRSEGEDAGGRMAAR